MEKPAPDGKFILAVGPKDPVMASVDPKMGTLALIAIAYRIRSKP